MAKLSEITQLGEVTANDLLLITDHETGKTRTVKWADVEASIVLDNIENGVIDGGVYAE